MHDIAPSGGGATASSKGEVTTQGDESEDMEILETPEERRPISEPPADEPATEEALVKISITEAISTGVTLPKTAPAAAEATALGVRYTKVTQGIMISTEVVTTVTSAPPDNDHNSSISNHFSYTISDLEAFAETPTLTAPITWFQEEATAPIMMDIAWIDVLYHSIIQCRPISTVASRRLMRRRLLLPPCQLWSRLNFNMSLLVG